MNFFYALEKGFIFFVHEGGCDLFLSHRPHPLPPVLNGHSLIQGCIIGVYHTCLIMVDDGGEEVHGEGMGTCNILYAVFSQS